MAKRTVEEYGINTSPRISFKRLDSNNSTHFKITTIPYLALHLVAHVVLWLKSSVHEHVSRENTSESKRLAANFTHVRLRLKQLVSAKMIMKIHVFHECLTTNIALMRRAEL